MYIIASIKLSLPPTIEIFTFFGFYDRGELNTCAASQVFKVQFSGGTEIFYVSF